MTTTIVNASPKTILLGIDDQSTRQPVSEPEVRPTHLPFVWLYTQKGPDEPQLVVGASLTEMYGAESFNLRAKWATHQTVLSNVVNAQGNSQMIKRIKPIDAGPPAAVRLWADVLPTQVPEYERNVDGSIRLDEDGDKVETGNMIAGFKVKFVVTAVTAAPGQTEDPFGTAQILPGDQTDPLNATQSNRYPILDLAAPSFGSYGNNNAFRIWAPTSRSSSPVNDQVIENEKVYPFRIACLARADELSSARLIASEAGEPYINFSFKKDTIDRTTDRDLYIGDNFLTSYSSFEKGFPPKWGPFGRMAVYDSNIQLLVEQFYNAEVPFIDSFSDFTGGVDEEYRFNFISGQSSQGVPYHSFILVNDASNSVVLTENSTLFARGGTDGTMNEDLFAGLVAEEAVRWGDRNERIQDTARYPVSFAYDTGFPLATKYALANFISVRKDTFLVMSTYDVNGIELSAADESSLAIAIKTRLTLFPESENFGTPTCRAMIIGRYGRMVGTQYRKKLPLTLEIAIKSAAYMGAGNQVWNNANRFDRDPGSQLQYFTDVNETFTPETVRNKDWTNGLVWVQYTTRETLFFPALKTIYNNDTSILNSYFTVVACCELEKIGEQVWRELSGASDLTEAQVIKEAQDRVNAKVAANGNFDGRYVVVPRAYFTAADTARGYSYHLEIAIYGANMILVQTLNIAARRISDLEQNNVTG